MMFRLTLCHHSAAQLFSLQMMLLHTPLLLALLGLVSGEEGARLLASKSLLNRYAVEGRDLTLQYNLYNVGSRLVWPEINPFWIVCAMSCPFSVCPVCTHMSFVTVLPWKSSCLMIPFLQKTLVLFQEC